MLYLESTFLSIAALRTNAQDRVAHSHANGHGLWTRWKFGASRFVPLIRGKT